MNIKVCEFVDCEDLQDSRFAPYEGDICYVIDDDIILHDGEVHDDFAIPINSKMFKIISEKEI